MSAALVYVAPVSGWRTWRIDQSGPEARLASVVRPAAWPVGEALVAECPWVTFAHHAPGPGCRCGIHAARDAAEAALHAELPSRAREPLAVGLASLWGRVVEGEAGWRASHGCGEIAWDLTAYGVPAGVLDCSRRGALEALRAMAPAARRPRPLPVAAPAEA